MRRVRFQLSAWKSHRPLPIPAKSPVAGCEPPRRDTPRCNLGRARQMRRGRCRGRITCVRTQRRRGAFSRGWPSSAGGVAGECPNNVGRGQPRSASGLIFQSEGRQLRVGRPPKCSQDPTSSVPRRRGLLPQGDDRLRGRARAKTGRAILRSPLDRRSRWLERQARARRGRGRPPLPGAACGAHFPCLCV